LTTANGFPATTLLDAWKQIKPFGYSALDAAFFASIVQTSLVSGHPVEAPGQAPQWLSAQLKDFNIHPLTDMKHHLQYIIYPNQWGAQVALEVNLGPIVQIVYQGCATIGVTYYTDGTADVTLTDPWPFPINGVLRVRQVDNTICADVGDKSFALIPKQTVIPNGVSVWQPELPIVSACARSTLGVVWSSFVCQFGCTLGQSS